MFKIKRKELENIMQSCGVSLISLSEGVGLAKSTLSKIINGYTSHPDSETIDTICNYLGVRRRDIIAYDDEIETCQDFDNENLRQNLLELMKKHEILSTRELSKRSGVSQNGVERILNGVNKKKPYSKTLYGLANYFGLTVSQLKGIDELPSSSLLENEGKIMAFKSSNLAVLTNLDVHKEQVRFINYHSDKNEARFAIDIDIDSYFPHFKNGVTVIIDRSIAPRENDYVVATPHGCKVDLFIFQKGNIVSLAGKSNFPFQHVEILGTIIEIKLASL